MRMISLNFNSTFAKDMTWATGTSVIWTQVESTVSVICACAPTLRIPLAHFFPFLFGTTTQESYQLSDGPKSSRVGKKTHTWKDQSTRSNKRGDSDELQTDHKSASSQERIVGIKKTLDIDMTYLEVEEDQPGN